MAEFKLKGFRKYPLLKAYKLDLSVKGKRGGLEKKFVDLFRFE
ncbi:MAG: hypothetical protein Q8N77_02205 [Nanoarchaeota archaeon]|nr:hypothetical protein [Nanoarchaeota archaeon]